MIVCLSLPTSEFCDICNRRHRGVEVLRYASCLLQSNSKLTLFSRAQQSSQNGPQQTLLGTKLWICILRPQPHFRRKSFSLSACNLSLTSRTGVLLNALFRCSNLIAFDFLPPTLRFSSDTTFEAILHNLWDSYCKNDTQNASQHQHFERDKDLMHGTMHHKMCHLFW